MTPIAETTIDQKKAKKGYVRLSRVFFIDDLSQLDLVNFGCHFSKSLGYQHKGGGEQGATKIERNLKVRAFAIIPERFVNQAATVASNEEFPHEQEVVLLPGMEIQVELSVQKKSDCGSWLRAEHFYSATVNTGSRYDRWVESYL